MIWRNEHNDGDLCPTPRQVLVGLSEFYKLQLEKELRGCKQARLAIVQETYAAYSKPSKDSSISLILTRNLMYWMKNTVSVHQNQKHALSCCGYTQSSHHCTTSLTKPAASETKQSFPCSDHSLQMSEAFSMEMQRRLD